mgnify:FL=1
MTCCPPPSLAHDLARANVVAIWYRNGYGTSAVYARSGDIFFTTSARGNVRVAVRGGWDPERKAPAPDLVSFSPEHMIRVELEKVGQLGRDPVAYWVRNSKAEWVRLAPTAA